jgi:hypothetical protein
MYSDIFYSALFDFVLTYLINIEFWLLPLVGYNMNSEKTQS